MYLYNHEYTRTNTAKSLLLALSKVHGEDALWLNGDVFFDDGVLDVLTASSASCCLVDEAECRDEEIKYRLDGRGHIVELSKQVTEPRGEAVGINMLKAGDIPAVCEALARVDDKDYFEKALENLAAAGRLLLQPAYLGDRFCQEIDFPHDLSSVRKHLKASRARGSS
jgi:choline kinase